jgi:hypothetical protein
MISQRCSGLVLPPAYATRHTSSLSSRTKMPTSELKFVGAEGFYSAAEGADKFFLVAPAAALKDGACAALSLPERPRRPLPCRQRVRRAAARAVSLTPPRRRRHRSGAAPRLQAAARVHAAAFRGDARSQGRLRLRRRLRVLHARRRDRQGGVRRAAPGRPELALLLRDPVHGHHGRPLRRWHHGRRQGRRAHRPVRACAPCSVLAHPAVLDSAVLLQRGRVAPAAVCDGRRPCLPAL